MGDLTRGMNTGIGAPRRSDRRYIAFQLGQGGFNRPLYAGLVGLTLPPGKGRAVIFQFYRITWHGAHIVPKRAPRQGASWARLWPIAPSQSAARMLTLSSQGTKGTATLVIGHIADSIGRQIEGVTQGVSGLLFEPVIRLGVTGLSRAGKTVFITSLVANLLDRGRMSGLEAARSGRIEAAFFCALDVPD